MFTRLPEWKSFDYLDISFYCSRVQTPDAFSEIVLLAHRLAKCIGESSAEKQDFAIS